MKWSGDVQVRCHRVKLGGRPHIPIRTAPNPIRVFPSVECSTLRNILHTYLLYIIQPHQFTYPSHYQFITYTHLYRVVVPERKCLLNPNNLPKTKTRSRTLPLLQLLRNLPLQTGPPSNLFSPLLPSPSRLSSPIIKSLPSPTSGRQRSVKLIFLFCHLLLPTSHSQRRLLSRKKGKRCA